MNIYSATVATTPTVYGIETGLMASSQLEYGLCLRCNNTYRLRYWNSSNNASYGNTTSALQQHLPFTVLKLEHYKEIKEIK